MFRDSWSTYTPSKFNVLKFEYIDPEKNRLWGKGPVAINWVSTPDTLTQNPKHISISSCMEQMKELFILLELFIPTDGVSDNLNSKQASFQCLRQQRRVSLLWSATLFHFPITSLSKEDRRRRRRQTNKQRNGCWFMWLLILTCRFEGWNDWHLAAVPSVWWPPSSCKLLVAVVLGIHWFCLDALFAFLAHCKLGVTLLDCFVSKGSFCAWL